MTALKHYFDFLWAMTEKEIKARYKGTIFGFLWVIISPILQMLIIGVVFSFFIKIPNYFLFLLIGLLPWSFFSGSVSSATTSIVNERSLLQKAKFPVSAIPISIILANYLHLIVSFIILFIFLLFIDAYIFPRILFLISGLIWLPVFTIGFSLFTATLQVRYRDMSLIIHYLLNLWFYVTPVLYNLTLIPTKIRFIFALNPLTSIFELFHHAIIKQGVISQQITFVNAIISAVVVILGVIVYRNQQKDLIDFL